MTTLALALSLSLFAQAKDPDAIRITLELENTPVDDAMSMVKEISGVPVEITDAARKKLGKTGLSIKIQDAKLQLALTLLVRPHGLDVKLVDKKKFVIIVPD